MIGSGFETPSEGTVNMLDSKNGGSPSKFSFMQLSPNIKIDKSIHNNTAAQNQIEKHNNLYRCTNLSM